MDIQTCAALCGRIAIMVVALSVVTAPQEPPTASAHYTVITRDGSEVDLGFARKWLDAAEQVMATKYHVVPDRYHVSVFLLNRPENDIDTTQSGQNRCCSIDSQGLKTGTIFLLGPSAPVWKERPLLSSLGLPKDGVDYHAKVLMSEYIPIGHYAVQDSRRGWSYYTAPSWFVQGLQEYDGIYHTTEANRADTAARLMRWARANEGRFACCARGIEFGDVYNGGAAFIAFLASAYGEGIHERILRSDAKTFDEALADQTSSLSRSELFDRFRAWVRDTQ
jgi:hypothetical protein